MKRQELEHIIRAAAEIADDSEIIVIGSQAILGTFPEAPPELLVSTEADVYPKTHRDRADLIDGSIGEGSPFHDTYGYYAQGVDETTAILPAGWEKRLVPVRNENTRGKTGWCLEPHDLVVSKTIAGREKDLLFLEGAARHGLVDRKTLLSRLDETELDGERRAMAAVRIRRAFQ
ncbi:MAG: DUF6036 family nucleotidyltransferase [Vicinamibacteria bacterium]